MIEVLEPNLIIIFGKWKFIFLKVSFLALKYYFRMSQKSSHSADSAEINVALGKNSQPSCAIL